MCMRIDLSVESLNKRVVWKVFDKSSGAIRSLFEYAEYPKRKLVVRSEGPTHVSDDDDLYGGHRRSRHGLYFYTSKAAALEEAKRWGGSYIAKFEVDPRDFLHASEDGDRATYERAKRVGNYIKVRDE